MHHIRLWLTADDLLVSELSHLRDEGKEIPPELEQRIRQLAARGDDYLSSAAGQAEAGALLDETIVLPLRADCKYIEPSDLAGIREQRPAAVALPDLTIPAQTRQDKLHGAWLGRCYGCYLGKPIEGLRRLADETFIMESFLKQTGQWPLKGYYSLDYPADLLASHNLNQSWKAGPAHMPEDDDTNYTTVGFALMEQKGKDFIPEDVATFWLNNIPILHTYTAERVAYRNFCINFDPPASASYRNPYREWIGAQIRADFYGYAAPGQPEKAAEYAWRDACISHIKNGIYGAMWMSAMLAAAYVTSDIATIIRAGLAQVPEKSRFTEALRQVFSWHASGYSYEEAVRALHARWNEKTAHAWCHTISNAQICTIALLWGGGDYAESISRAVLPGFDTDCNGATVGSVMGMILGAKALPQDLVGRLNDRILTGVQGYLDCSIADMSEKMNALIDRLKN
jgi:ADP-ribosylglycohydrolase